MTKIIAIANQKGGVGKTTTSVNLSAGLATIGKKVLLIDTDPQGNATSGVGVNKSEIEQSIYDVLIDELPLEEIIHKTGIEHLCIAPTTIALAGAEIELVSTISREARLKNAIKKVQNDFDYIIIDCPPSLGLLTLNALTAADAVIIPVQCEFYALEGLSQLLSTISLVQKHLNEDLLIDGVLLTMFDVRTNLSTQVAEEVKKFFEEQVYETIIPRSVRLSEAPSHGESILQYDPKSKGAEVYLQFAKEVAQHG
ncbi:sporulation initiation inhibitor Soj [Kurthia zopfii]|uniref:Sporulation initiation inhibitor protein Soj n=1 Tax=Kurthia zopfii TaxID=1650 RepID=A0A2U3AAF4_9BACL|nr:AAA family ATPase [Kurthia zopfii]PWI21523.1 sporulation initiation inhibitor Soj [Kurthia zopfii]TDR34767.1 chromosome segregation ATPase [Kurthia zopfii]STX11256.1 Sporulation initiation inhibitor protein soj [Kurthia zopfii]VEI05391.1 Sporulation initiation inhibitor protein soj [Kurthia zopfii]GEK31246.1 sporulation initiation inhibitor Soj [Kurthia zopfii]